MTLFVHRAQRCDLLVEALADLLTDPLPDPMTPEVVAVSARGMERWVRQRLSHRLGTSSGPAGDGVCANIDLPTPAELLTGIVTRLAGADPADDPWAPNRLLWHVLAVLDEEADQPWCQAPADYLGLTGSDPLAQQRRGRRVMFTRHVADLFTRYAADRPQMVQDWSQGRDTDGYDDSVPDQHAWQPALWRRLCHRLPGTSPTHRLLTAVDRLRQGVPVGLPARVSVFGPTRLATADLMVLDALGTHRDVHLWLPDPAPQISDHPHLDTPTPDHPTPKSPHPDTLHPDPMLIAGVERRSADSTAANVRNALLRNLGRDSRELRQRVGDRPGRHLPSADVVPTAPLLNQLQALIGRDEELPASLTVRPDDTSVQIHGCYGPARQVEVLREVITGLLANDPTLQPRDILVMCPDIEQFAPLVLAAFGANPDDGSTPEPDRATRSLDHPGQRLRVRLADRALRQVNPVLDVLARLLSLAGSRVTSAQVMDLAASPPVRRRFAFTDDDLARAREWVAQANIRWGLTAADRADYGLDLIADNTWHRGLDRLLQAVSNDPSSHRVDQGGLPLDAVESSDIDLAGRVTEFVVRLAGTLRTLTGTRPVREWITALGAGLDRLTLVGEVDGWQRSAARHLLGSLTVDAIPALTTPVCREDIIALLETELRGRPTRASFRTGDLTVCSMVPMRSVPHPVICLLGLDDGDFPRSSGRDGDDVLAVNPVVGEHDPAAEDRQLLLDAILAARTHLIIVHSAADERTGGSRPPAVPLGDLVDALRSARTATGAPAHRQFLIRHPLRTHDLRNFRSDALISGPFSFDPAAAAAAALADAPQSRHRPGTPALLRGPLPPPDTVGELDLDTVIRFLEHPVRGFLRQRLGVSVDGDEEDLAEELSVELDGLAAWQVADRMLRARLAGRSPVEVATAERRRGGLPPGHLGEHTLQPLARHVESIVTAARPHLTGPASGRQVRVQLPDGRLLRGVVGGLHERTVTRVEYSTIAARHRLRAWLQVLALSADATTGDDWQAVTIGGRTPRGYRLRAPQPDQAIGLLAGLVAARDVGLCQPLPLPLDAALVYAGARRRGRRPEAALLQAQSSWDRSRFGERYKPVNTVVFGDLALTGIDQVTARTDPSWPATAHGETTWFRRLAVAVFTPLLAHEEPL